VLTGPMIDDIFTPLALFAGCSSAGAAAGVKAAGALADNKCKNGDARAGGA
jgi:hypothetical protein